MHIFTPRNGTVMVLRDEVKEKRTDGGLYIADQAIELANTGEVRAVADDVTWLEIGDRVIFTKYAGSEFELNGVPYILIKDKEIQGKVREVEMPAAPQEDLEQVAQEALAKLAATATDTTQQ
jgi:chaperonin GroES